MAQKKSKPKGLKIGELARLAGVSIPTIKHYLNEGLLPRPVKTGRTMSYYDRACVERVRLIKRLRTERFLPLNVIKKIIESGASLNGELALGEAMMNVPAFLDDAGVVKRKSISKSTGYSLAKIDRMETLGLIHPSDTSTGKEYDSVDRRIVSLVRQREEVGLPFDYSLEMMSMYRRHIQNIVKEDAKFFVRHMMKNADAGDAARYIRGGDQALGQFMSLIRAKLARDNAERIIDCISSAEDNVKEALCFRTLDKSSKARAAVPKKSERLFQLMSGRTAFDNNRARTGLGARDIDSETITLGTEYLISGRPEDALEQFNRLGFSERNRAMISVLSGLAHVARTSHVPGFLAPLNVINEALACFESSCREMPDAGSSPFTFYFRGAGLSIVPEVFDRHSEAERDLLAVIESESREYAAIKRSGSLKKRLGGELRAKAQYFLAAMYLRDGLDKSAENELRALIRHDSKGFYGKWARKKLKDI